MHEPLWVGLWQPHECGRHESLPVHGFKSVPHANGTGLRCYRVNILATRCVALRKPLNLSKHVRSSHLENEEGGPLYSHRSLKISHSMKRQFKNISLPKTHIQVERN